MKVMLKWVNHKWNAISKDWFKEWFICIIFLNPITMLPSVMIVLQEKLIMKNYQSHIAEVHATWRHKFCTKPLNIQN